MTTSASVFAPREIVKLPAIGQRSVRMERESAMAPRCLTRPQTASRGAGKGAKRRARHSVNGGHVALCPPYASTVLLEPARRVGQHGVDLAGIRGEIAAGRRLAALIRRNLVEQPLELHDVAVDGRLELAVATIAVADLLECLLALHRVEAAREHVALAALVAFPELGRRIVIDHASDIDRERVERLDRAARLTAVRCRRGLALVARGAPQAS